MIRTVITESEALSSNRLKSLLEKFPSLQLIGEAFDGEEAVSIVDGLKPDLLFLNLQLPQTDGFETLKSISYSPTVIFTTSYKFYLIKTFEENFIDYLLKPFSAQRFEKILQRALQRNQKLTKIQIEKLQDALQVTTYLNRFPVKSGHKDKIIPAEKAVLFEEKERHVYLHTYDNKYLCDIPLRELENLLDSDRFYRVNKYQIVALHRINKLRRSIRGTYKIILKDRIQIAVVVEKEYLSGLRKKLKSRIISPPLPFT